jgi:putative ABC transport system substrate-binding protein
LWTVTTTAFSDQLKVDVITALTLGAKAAQQATKTIPIVMAYSNDPIGNGVIASINRPGRNVTGLASSADDTTPKQLELLATVVPNLSRISVLMNPANFKTHAPMLKAAQISADILGLVALTAEARNLQELDAAFVEMTKQRAGAMMVIADSFFFSGSNVSRNLRLGHAYQRCSQIVTTWRLVA